MFKVLFQGFVCSRPRVARLMQANGIQAKMFRKFNMVKHLCKLLRIASKLLKISLLILTYLTALLLLKHYYLVRSNLVFYTTDTTELVALARSIIRRTRHSQITAPLLLLINQLHLEHLPLQNAH